MILAAYALAAGFGAPAALRRDWARRSPRIATRLWLILAASWLTAVPLAALTLLTPFSLTWQAAGSRAAGILSGTPAAAAGILLVAALVLRASWHLARVLCHARREQRAHAAFLAAAGRPDPALGVVIFDGGTPAAYCLPRGRHQVAISAGALTALTPGQLKAVLTHERAHLRGHHHLMLAIAWAMARAFPPIPLLARAPGELSLLTEMTADDEAARRHGPDDLAAALVTLAGAGSNSAALAAGGPAAIARIQRLLAPSPQPGFPARTARLIAEAAAFLIPAAIAGLPLAIAACDIVTRT